jgi:hypothetical protein
MKLLPQRLLTISSHPTYSFSESFLVGVVEDGVQLGPLGTAATNKPIVPALGDYDDSEIGGMIGTIDKIILCCKNIDFIREVVYPVTIQSGHFQLL